MSFKECQINLIDFNFHLQKSLKIFDKNSADEIWSKNHMEIKVSPLMPIRVKKVDAFRGRGLSKGSFNNYVGKKM